MIESLFKPYVLAGAVLVFVCLLWFSRRQKAPALPDLPWLNTKDGELFTRLRSRFRSTFNYKETIRHAYQEYSKKDQSCILAGLSDTEILLPASAIKWLISQPDSVLSADEPHRDVLQADITFPMPYVVQNPVHHETITRDLTRQLGNLTTDIMEELTASFDEIWGTDRAEWREVCPYSTLQQIVARTSNRVFVGLPACRDRALLDHGIGFATAIPLSAIILRPIPALLRPLAALVIARPNIYHTKSFTRIIRPEIERRLKRLQSQGGDVEKKGGEAEPNDFLQWSIHRALESPDAAELAPEIISGRLLAVNFAAIHTSTFTITNAVFDLVASDPSLEYIDQLRDEAASVLANDDGVWTKSGLAKMYKTDSTLRESSRLGSFQGTGLVRKVISPAGITAPNGTFCPYGTNISVPTNSIHEDPALYADPATFQPFRFSSQRVPLDQAPTEKDKEGMPSVDVPPATSAKGEEYIKKANLSFVSVSPTYHPFGYGRHACPGRFFAANELKLLLAYMVLNYDFEMLDKRPESKCVGTNIVPPMTATIKIRRRGTASASE